MILKPYFELQTPKRAPEQNHGGQYRKKCPGEPPLSPPALYYLVWPDALPVHGSKGRDHKVCGGFGLQVYFGAMQHEQLHQPLSVLVLSSKGRHF